MPDDLKITIDELQRRMKAGEGFLFLDARSPEAWAESDVMMPQAIRVPVEKFEEHLYEIPKASPIVAYCT